MLCANPMPRADDASLEQGERGFNAIGVNVAFDVNALLMADRLVSSSMQSGFHHGGRIGGKFVSHDYVNGIGRNVLSDVLRQRSALNVIRMEEAEFTAGIRFRVP